MNEQSQADVALDAAARVRVPQHVVYRQFPHETVMLNLNTGRYHGLNASAGRMLEALERAPVLSEAAVRVSEDYGQSRELIEQDLMALCQALLERDLIEIDDGRVP